MNEEKRTVNEIIEEEKMWSKGSIVLYHVTPIDNTESIMLGGVRPDLSRGKLKTSWYVTKAGITWAIAHVSIRHRIPVSDIAVMVCLLPMFNVRKTGVRHAWCTKDCFKPDNWFEAEMWIAREALSNE